MSVIALSHITKDYGGGHGVFDVSFAVEQGEVFGFLGPNGAGKTTTIRQLMGFLAPDSGTCTINGLDCRTQTAAIQKNMGYIPGEPALPDDMRGGEFIRFLAAYRGMRGTGRAGELCERFELDASGRIRRMSKGMKQKVAIVCALMHDPAVLILDEPTSGLDPLMQNRFIDLILEEKQRGKTVLMSSHMFEEVERTCARVGILREGRLAAVEEIGTLKARRSRTYSVTLSTPDAAAAFAAAPGPAGAGCAGLHGDGARAGRHVRSDHRDGPVSGDVHRRARVKVWRTCSCTITERRRRADERCAFPAQRKIAVENMGGFCGRAFAVCVHDHSHVRPQAQRHTGRDRDGHASAHEYGGHAGGQQLAGRVPHQLSVRLSAAASASGIFHSGGEPAGRALGGHGQYGLSAGLAQHPGAGSAHPGAGAHCGRYAAYRLLYGAGPWAAPPRCFPASWMSPPISW